MELLSFKAAYPQLRELYGLELNPDEFETIGMIGWDKIGNKMLTIEKVTAQVINGIVTLPCDVEAIESVTMDLADFQQTSNLRDTPLIYNQYVEKYIDLRRGNNLDPTYVDGKFVKYRPLNENQIQISRPDGWVNIMYRSLMLDEDGLPKLNVKEVDAIAAYVAYAYTFKHAMMTRDQSTMQLSQILEQKWLKLCDHARTPMHMSQNDFDAIGDVRQSWDRKMFGKSFKPIK